MSIFSFRLPEIGWRGAVRCLWQLLPANQRVVAACVEAIVAVGRATTPSFLPRRWCLVLTPSSISTNKGDVIEMDQFAKPPTPTATL
jgi:hypothetical protein